MPRPKLIVRPKHFSFHMGGELAGKLELYLFSERQGKVPFGAYQKFFEERTTEFFSRMGPKKELKAAELALEAAQRQLLEVQERGTRLNEGETQ